MLVYLTDVRDERVVIIQVTGSANPSSHRRSSSAPLAPVRLHAVFHWWWQVMRLMQNPDNN